MASICSYVFSLYSAYTCASEGQTLDTVSLNVIILTLVLEL